MDSILHSYNVIAIAIVANLAVLRLRGHLFNSAWWNPELRGFRIGTWVLSTLSLVTVMSMAPISAYLGGWVFSPSPPAGFFNNHDWRLWAVFWYLIVIYIPSAIIFLLMWWGEYRWVRRRPPADSRRERVLTGTMMALMGTFIPMIGLWMMPTVPDLLRTIAGLSLAFTVLAVILIARKLTPGSSKVETSGSDEFVVTPLGEDMARLTSQYHRTWKPWTLSTTNKKRKLSPARERTVVFAYWWQRFRGRSPAVPVEMVRSLGPDGVAAVMALQYARRYRPIASRRFRWFDGRELGRYVRFVLMILVPAIATGIVGGMFQFGAPAWQSILVAASAAVAWVLLMLRIVRPDPTIYADAWNSWAVLQREAGLPATPAAFVAGLIQYDDVVHYELSREQISRLVLANAGLTKFLAKTGEGAMDELKALLDEWSANETAEREVLNATPDPQDAALGSESKPGGALT